MKWLHFEADSEVDEFWSSEIQIHKGWCVEVHVGKDSKTKKFDFQLLDQGREFVFRKGFATRKSAEVAMRAALCMILQNAAIRLGWVRK